MGKVLYCHSKGKKPDKKNFPIPCFFTSSIAKARQKDYSVIICDYSFIKKRRKADLSFLKEKISLLSFEDEQARDLGLTKKLGFFDFFSLNGGKANILFKVKRAQLVAELKKQNLSLENKISQKNFHSEKLILIDSLTGCHNWRYFYEEAKRQLVRSKRYSEKVSFIGIDIDHFRRINEIYGIKVADKLIKKIVKLISKNLRKEDTLSRWRDDEFFVIAPHLNKKDLIDITHRLQKAISTYRFKYKNVSLRVQVSIGAVNFPEDSIFSSKDVVLALGRAIAQAKRKGGNAIVISSKHQLKPAIKKKERVTIKEMRKKVEKLNILLNKDVLDIIYGFARAVEAKDAYTGSHVEYTAEIAKNIAKELSLPANEIKDIERAAVLHDLGKVGIDEKILSKKGALTDKEREIIKTHPSIASEILKDIYGLRGAIPGVLYHHERFDGKGYPLGLKEDEIPLAARIVAVADVFQALVSDRPYRKAYSKEKAIKIIKEESGSHFDPKIVKIFLKVIQKID